MTISEKLLVLFATLAVLFFCFISVFTKASSKSFGGSVNYTAAQSSATSTAVTVTTASTMVQATTTRISCLISNDSGKTVYLSLDGLAAVANTDYVLQASTTLLLSNEAATGYSGAIFGISPGGNANVTAVCF